jgi:hypothetical protein
MFERLNGHGAEETSDRFSAYTPFLEVGTFVNEDRAEIAQGQLTQSAPMGAWQVETPFLRGEAGELGETVGSSAEAAALAELTTELKDSEFRESLEQLASEAIETHGEQLAGEYGDREARDASAEHLLNEHFQPLAAQTEAMLDRFFERLEGYEAESLTDSEIARIASEVYPTGVALSPASEQFLGGFLRKVGKVVSGAVNFAKKGVEGAVKLAGQGLAAVGKLALGPLLSGLKKLAGFLLRHVVRFALGQLPPAVRPLAQKLSDRLFNALGETHEGEAEEHEQTESEVNPATSDAARLEAEFDLHAAQLLLAPDQGEADHLVASYGEGEPASRSLAELDNARVQFAGALQRLQAGESPQPVMEQFLPAALWPIAKTAITILGRPKLVSQLGGLLSGLIRPMVGDAGASVLAPAIADAGLRVFGLETAPSDPRAVAAEALTATVEDTMHRLAELPPAVFENETWLEAETREAFEAAAASYFPPSMIRPELRETADHHGVWARMPFRSQRKRYAKYSATPEVTITPRLASSIRTFGGATLRDHLRDRMQVPDGRVVKTKLRLFQALPGTRAVDIARAEGIRPRDLHPLTRDAAAALLGPNAALGTPGTPRTYLATPHKLHVRQRLYYIEPPSGRDHHHRHRVRLARSELLINLRAGEIKAWLYLSEPLCQQVSAELSKTRNAAAAFRLIKPLVQRVAEMVRTTVVDRHLPPELRIISEVPNLDARVPSWLVTAGNRLAAKVEEWMTRQLVAYLRENAEEFRRVSAAPQDGLTLRLTMTGVPGLASIRAAGHGRSLGPKQELSFKGMPAIVIHAQPGYAIR